MNNKIKKPWEHPNFKKVIMKCNTNQYNQMKSKLIAMGWTLYGTELNVWQYVQNHEINRDTSKNFPYVIGRCPYGEKVDDELYLGNFNEELFLKYCGYEEPKAEKLSKDITLREHFAGLAMQGLLATCSNDLIAPNEENIEYFVSLSNVSHI